MSRKYECCAAYDPPLTCEGPCGVTNGTVKHRDSRTMYWWDGTGEDPNRDRILCDQCAAKHDEYWDAMWAEVPRG